MADRHRVTGSIVADGHGRVVWTMTPRDALDLADFIEDHIKWDDQAHADVDALRAAAFIAGPDRD